MGPVFVAAVETFFGRWRTGGIAFQPDLNVVVVELLGPQHAGIRLAHDVFGVAGKVIGNAGSVEFVGFGFAKVEEAIEASSKVVGAGRILGAVGMRSEEHTSE